MWKNNENNVGKREIAYDKKFLLFPQCFLPYGRNFLSFSSYLKLSSPNSDRKSLEFVIWEKVKPVHVTSGRYSVTRSTVLARSCWGLFITVGDSSCFVSFVSICTSLSVRNVFDFTFFDSLPNDKIVDWSKLKAFADNKIKALEMMIFVFDRVENIVGKGENAGYQHFFFFPQCFLKAIHSGSLKVGTEW